MCYINSCGQKQQEIAVEKETFKSVEDDNPYTSQTGNTEHISGKNLSNTRIVDFLAGEILLP